MSMADTASPGSEQAIPLPEGLRRRLLEFRGLVWRVKLVEAVCGAVAGILVGYLLVFLLDRLGETPGWARWAAFAVAVLACAAVPVAFHRWIWRHRSLEQVARLVGRRFPSLGDQLLGIIEIVRESAAGRTFGRSRTLCAAAVGQVSDRAESVDFRQAVPPARVALASLLAAVPLAVAGAVAAGVPAAAANAWVRFLAPWRDVDRYTFTRLEPLPARLVVPLGEEATFDVPLSTGSVQRPGAATARVGRQRPLAAKLARDAAGREAYTFAVPPQLETAPLALAAGDARGRTVVEPLLRPDIMALEAEIRLPEYLGRPEPVRLDVRGGGLAPVVGSEVVLAATASRDLARAWFRAAAPEAAAAAAAVRIEPDGDRIGTPPLRADEPLSLWVEWEDTHGLSGAKPLTISIEPRPDAAPSVVVLDGPASRSMLLDSDTLRFRLTARDDFGVRRLGIAWAAAEESGTAVTRGDRLVAAGGPDAEFLDVPATFCPQALGIPPQPILLRGFVEDYLPGRGRVHSAPLLIYVVDKSEHALVINERLNRWRQRAGEVRDREMALLAANREFRQLPEEALLEDETRRRVESQAVAEEANARRLDRLVDEGTDLVREALKNPEFEAGTLDQLAGDIQTLADIADSRMPTVADLLRQAARATLPTAAGSATAGTPAQGTSGQEPSAEGSEAAGEMAEHAPTDGSPAAPSSQDASGGGTDKPAASATAGTPSTAESAEPPPKVGEDRGGAGAGTTPAEGGPPPLPQVVDRESSQQPPGAAADGDEPAGSGQGRFGLPSTQAGVAPPRPPADGQPASDSLPADAALDAAIASQEALLEEFAKVADDLAAVMARLEGSTFVKRFKLASREQAALGGRIAALEPEAFGRPERRPPEVRQAMGDAVESSVREVEKVSNLMDDLQAYFDRRQLPAFRTVLEEMKDLDTLGSLRQLADDIPREAGMSIAQAEFWSDTFDRLADDLVPPPGDAQEGSGDGEQESLPPDVVLEAMRILEAEVNLREETRVAEQARAGLEPDAHAARALELAEVQEDLAARVAKLSNRLVEAAVGGPLFGKDAPLFGPLELPDGRDVYQQEIALFDRVEEVMLEAADILRTLDTGSAAIAAETEAIELLLASQAAGGGGGGGGGGSAAGGGSTGTTQTPALALVGRGNRTKGGGEEGEREQATGTSGRVLPEEFRAGLDAYFNRFEKERP
jgi:hypothetical protein